MKNFKKIIILVSFIFCGMAILAQGSITIHRDSYLEENAACPKTEYQYWVDIKSNYGNYEWKITGGSFMHFGQKVKEIFLPNTSSVIVIWDNVKSSGDNAPEGTITLNVYNKYLPSQIEDKDKRDQVIKSLNDRLPPPLKYSATTPQLNFGEQEIKIYLENAFNFPGITKNGFPIPVTQYEWEIPAGWMAKTGSATTKGTFMTTTSEIKLITDSSSGGDVMVRGINDCAGSGDYSEYSWPLTFTRKAGIELLEYPENVIIGEVRTYKFSVMLLTGVSYEWSAPSSWSINGEGNTYVGGNVVQITTSECPTSEKVKVRMVQEDNFSPWVEFPTTTDLPAINIPEEINQYQTETFSLNMAEDDIELVEWFVDGNSVGVSNNTSSISFFINEFGKVNVSAILTLNGCSAVTIPEVEVEIVKAPDPIILGPSSFCDDAEYSINNLPFGATVYWSVSRNLRISGGQGTSSVTVSKMLDNSNNIITAEITISGSSITINKRGVRSGGDNPSILLSPLAGPLPGPHVEYGETGKRYWLHAYGSNLSNNDADYRWQIYSADPFELPIGGIGRQIEYTQVAPGDYSVSLQYNGECGWTDEVFRTIRFE